MRRQAILILMLSLINQGFGQEKKKEIRTGNVMSATVFGVADLTTSSLDKKDTRWLELPGYGFTGGAGIQVSFNNNFGIEVDFGYEYNLYPYDHVDLRLNLGYKVPYIDLKVTKFFKRGEQEDKHWYIKVGGAYQLANGKSLTESDDFHYTYSIALAPSPVIAIMPEIGLQRRISGNHRLQTGLLVKYAFSNLATNTMIAHPELNSAVATTGGNYIGITMKYLFGFWSIGGGGSGSSGGKDPKIRIEI